MKPFFGVGFLPLCIVGELIHRTGARYPWWVLPEGFPDPVGDPTMRMGWGGLAERQFSFAR